MPVHSYNKQFHISIQAEPQAQRPNTFLHLQSSCSNVMNYRSEQMIHGNKILHEAMEEEHQTEELIRQSFHF